MLVFRGIFGTGEDIQALSGFPDKAAAEGFITAAGNGVGESWPFHATDAVWALFSAHRRRS